MARAELIIELRDKVSKGLTSIGKRMQKIGRQFNQSKFVFAAVGAGIAAVGGLALKAAGQFEQWRISFTTMLGSADRADILLEKIKRFAAETPFDLPQVVKGGRALLAFGVEADKVIPTMKTLGDVSAGLGVPMERLILNFGQVKAQAKLTGRELRDFAVAGVPLLAVLAKNLNKTQAEITNLVSAGAIGFKEVEDAFASMAGEGGRFANLMAKQMESLEGKISNVGDVVFQLGVAFGDILLPKAKKFAEILIQVGDKLLSLDKNTKKNIVTFAAITVAIAGLAAGIGAFLLVAGPLAAAFAVLLTVIAPVIAIVGILSFTILGLKDDFVTVGGFITEIFRKIANGVIEEVKRIFSFIKPLRTLFSKLLPDSVKKGFDSIINKILEFGESAKDATETIGFEIKDAFSDFAEDITKTFKNMATSSKTELNSILIKFKKHVKELLKIQGKSNKDLGKDQGKSDKEGIKKLTAFEKFKLFLKDEAGEATLSNLQTTLGNIAAMQQAHNKFLAGIGKAAAIAAAIINAALGISIALRSTPFAPVNLALAATVAAAGAVQIATISGAKLAEGGIVPAREGGTLATVGEGGKSEAIIPLDDDDAAESLGAVGGVTINVGVLVGGEESVRELAKMIDEELFDLRRNNQSVAFEAF